MNSLILIFLMFIIFKDASTTEEVYNALNRTKIDLLLRSSDCPIKYLAFSATLQKLHKKCAYKRKDLIVILPDYSSNLINCEMFEMNYANTFTILTYTAINQDLRRFEMLKESNDQIYLMLIGQDTGALDDFLSKLLNRHAYIVFGFYDGVKQEYLRSVFHRCLTGGLSYIVALVNVVQKVYLFKGRIEMTEECELTTKLYRNRWSFYESFDSRSILRSEKPFYNSCTVNITSVITPPNSMIDPNTSRVIGFETEIIRIIAKDMLFAPNIKVMDYVNQSGVESLSTVGALEDVFSGSSEMSYSVLWPNVDRYTRFDITSAIENDCLTWVTPHGLGKASLTHYLSGYLTSIFRLKGWVTLFGSIIAFILVGVIKTLIFDRKRKLLESAIRYSLDAISMLMAKPVSELFYRSNSMRIVLIFWLLYSLLICSIYSAILSIYLILPAHVEEVNSLKELILSDIELGGPLDRVRSVRAIETNETVFKVVQERMNVMEPASKFMGLMGKGSRPHLAYCTNLETAYYYGMKLKMKGETPQFHVLTDCFITHPIVFALKKGSPIMYRTKVLINRILAAGLVPFWKSRLRVKPKPIKIFQPEDIYKLKYIFYMYFIGITLATIVLILEIVRFRMTENMKEAERKRRVERIRRHRIDFNPYLSILHSIKP